MAQDSDPFYLNNPRSGTTSDLINWLTYNADSLCSIPTFEKLI